VELVAGVWPEMDPTTGILVVAVAHAKTVDGCIAMDGSMGVDFP